MRLWTGVMWNLLLLVKFSRVFKVRAGEARYHRRPFTLTRQVSDKPGEFNRSMQHHPAELLLLKGWRL
jgi:hypothetical protein